MTKRDTSHGTCRRERGERNKTFAGKTIVHRPQSTHGADRSTADARGRWPCWLRGSGCGTGCRAGLISRSSKSSLEATTRDLPVERLSEHMIALGCPSLTSPSAWWPARRVSLVDTATTLTQAAVIGVRALTGRCATHIVLTHKHFSHVLGSSGFTDASVYAAPGSGRG